MPLVVFQPLTNNTLILLVIRWILGQIWENAGLDPRILSFFNILPNLDKPLCNVWYLCFDQFLAKIKTKLQGLPLVFDQILAKLRLNCKAYPLVFDQILYKLTLNCKAYPLRFDQILAKFRQNGKVLPLVILSHKLKLQGLPLVCLIRFYTN